MAGGDAGRRSTRPPPSLGAFARRIVQWVGEPGAGQAMKLAVNLVVHDLNAALAEALVLAEERWYHQRKMPTTCSQESVVAAPFVLYKRAAFLDPRTPVAMSLDLVTRTCGSSPSWRTTLGCPIAVTERRASRSVHGRRCEAGFGPHDMASLSRFLPTQRVALGVHERDGRALPAQVTKRSRRRFRARQTLVNT